jgi:four helix bundle protein
VLPYERFKAWQLSYELTLVVYQVTTSFPKHELYGLTSQARRAAFSVAANIAEGSAKRGSAEFRRFLDISLGSMSELSVTLRLARDLKFLSPEKWEEVEHLRSHAGMLLWRLYDAVAKKAKRQVGSPPTARYRPFPPATA